MPDPTDSPTDNPRPKPRRRRRLAYVILAALGLLLLMVASLPLALRSASVRGAVLERVSAAVAEATGIHLTAADFSVDWRQTGVELSGVELRAAEDATPFLQAGRVRAEVLLRSLATRDVRLRQVEVDAPAIDLGAPLPEPGPEPEDAEEDRPRTVSIERFEIRGGSVALAGDTFAADSWLERLSLERIDLGGMLEASALLEAVVSQATVTVTRRGAEPVDLALEGRLAGSLTGPLNVDALSLAGPGLDLDATGRVGFQAGQPFDFDFKVAMEPGRLVPDLTAGGSLAAEGRYDARQRTGRASVQAEDLPAKLVEPWLGRQAMERLGAAGTRLDAATDLDLDAGMLTGTSTVDWRRGEVPLLQADADLERLRLADDGTPDLDSLAGTLRVAARDLAPQLVESWLGPGTFEQLAAAGTRLDVTADVDSGSGREPGAAGRVDVVWRDADVVLLTASARASDADDGLPLSLRAELLPASPGRRRFSGALHAADWSELATARIEGGRGEIELPDVAAAVDELRERWPLLVPEAADDEFFEGSLEAATDVAGRLPSPRFEGAATWRRNDGATVTFTGAGEPVTRQGQTRLEIGTLDLTALRGLVADTAPELAGLASGWLELGGDENGWTAAASAEGQDVRWDPELPPIDRWALEVDSDGSRLRIRRLEAVAGDRRLAAGGDLELAPPLSGAGGMPRLERAELTLEVERPIDGLERVHASVEVADGSATIDASEIDLVGGRGMLRATVPLAAFAGVPEVGDALAEWTGPDRLAAAAAEGPIELRYSLPAFDASTLVAGEAEAPEIFNVATSGELTIEPADPTAGRGNLELSALTVAWNGHRVEIAQPLRLRLADRRLATESSRLELDGRVIELAAGAELAPGWRPPDSVGSLVRHVDARIEGPVAAELLNPYLEGASASGLLHLDLDLGGPLDELSGRLSVRGPDARLVTLSPYFTRLEDPQIELELEAGQAILTLVRARLNQGSVELTGTLEPDGGLELFAAFEAVRYRLDYGLSTVLSGNLDLTLPAEGRGRLDGRVVVDRGLLRRDLNLESEILGQLMAPVEPSSAVDPDDPLARLDLDLEIASADGVRIKNNLADLRATWSPLTVRGTLAAPRVDGRLDVEAGGYAYLYGQTVRVDQATVTLAGFPELPPEIDLDVTTSLEDPNVAREGAAGFQWTPATRDSEQIEADRQALLTAGVASHYADRLAGRLGQVLGGTRVSVAPLLVFGEADPGARLTVSRDLSTQVAVAVSVDLTAEGRQIYLLDLHEFHRLPRMSAQLFTNDARNQGVTLQQSFELGGQVDETLPRLHRLRIEVPEGFEVKGLAAAAGLRRGDRLPEGVDFEIEVDLAEHLRYKGYPGAEVTARLEPASGGARDLIAIVEPGPRVAFDFLGTALPRAARRSIRGLYRIDYFEPAAIEEMRREAVRALHDLGYPRPEVTIEVTGGDPDGDGANADRTVVIEAHGGDKQPIDVVELQGVPEDVAGRLAASFVAQGDRIALAAGLEDADRRLLGLLRGAGYPEPRIASRRIDDGERLIVELAPGGRRRITEVTIEGIDAEEAERLRGVLSFAAGDPARSDLIARGVIAIERDLRRRGHVQARARPHVAVPDSESLDLTYRVEPGPRYEVADLRFDGAAATGERWAARVTRLESGEPVDPEELGAARRRLFDTGLFRSVVPDTELGDEGRATVVFEVRERPRYQISYGLRWESSVGAGAVVDAFDRNAFGRGVTLGARALLSSDDKSARVYSIFPEVFGTRATVELYVEGRRLREQADFGALLTNRFEGTFQVSYPLGRRTTTRGYYRYRDSHRFEEAPDPAGVVFDQRLRSPVLGWQLVHDTRNDKIDATRGLLSSLDLTGAGDALGADTRFVRFFGKTSLFRQIGRTGLGPVTWAQSWRVGLAEAFGGQELGRDDRFFAGGELSVRGYREQSLGPRELLGSTVAARGGEALLVVNQELRWPLPWGLRGVAFLDAGNVWESPSDFGSDLLTAGGLGLRAATPVGLVRLDVAFPLDRREEDDEFKVYLGLGNVF